MRNLFIRSIVTIVLLACANRAEAIGWDSNDFLIGGGPSFTNRIGVFDHDLTFKGYLDAFEGVQGLDFDAAGNLVAVSPQEREVRVYNSAGTRVGGFIRADDAISSSDDLKVAPDGSYIIAQSGNFGAFGAKQFRPDGTFVQQFSNVNVTSVAVVPGNRVWIGGPGITETRIRVYDIASGLQVGSVSMPGQIGRNSMSYSASTQTVLIVDVPNDAIFEADLNGGFLRRFDAPINVDLNDVIRGPGGDVFATDGFQRVVRWHADGEFVGAVSTTSAIGYPGGIVWAGNVPEPRLGLDLVVVLAVTWQRRIRVFRH